MSYNEKSADEFERQLAQNLRNASPYIPDDGFTQALMLKLPQAKKAYRPSAPVLVMSGLVALLIFLLGLSTFIAPVIQWFSQMNLAAVIHLGLWMLAMMVAGVLGWLGRRLELL